MKNPEIKPDAQLEDPTKAKTKQITCWSCLAVLNVSPYWGIIQCPSCQKFNRVADCDDKQEKNENVLKANKNHFQVASPYVYVVMTCPYCHEENKVKKETEHVVCYNCYNSFSIENPTIKCVSSRKQVTLPGTVTRVSDVNFPDPMYYPGYYPQEITNIPVPMDVPIEIKKKVKKVPPPIIMPDKFSALRKMMGQVGEIEYERNAKFDIDKDKFGKYGSLRGRSSLPSYGKLNELNNYNFSNMNNDKSELKLDFSAPALPGELNTKNKDAYSQRYTPQQSFNNKSFLKRNFVNNMMFSNWNNSYKI